MEVDLKLTNRRKIKAGVGWGGAADWDELTAWADFFFDEAPVSWYSVYWYFAGLAGVRRRFGRCASSYRTFVFSLSCWFLVNFNRRRFQTFWGILMSSCRTNRIRPVGAGGGRRPQRADEGFSFHPSSFTIFQHRTALSQTASTLCVTITYLYSPVHPRNRTVTFSHLCFIEVFQDINRKETHVARHPFKNMILVWVFTGRAAVISYSPV